MTGRLNLTLSIRVIVMVTYILSCIRDSLTKTHQTFLQDFLEILKRSLSIFVCPHDTSLCSDALFIV